MYSLRRTLSSGSLASQAIRSILLNSSQIVPQQFQETRCVILLLNHHRNLSAQTCKISPKSSQNKVISSSTGPGGQISGQVVTSGAKGRTLPPYMVFRYAHPTSTGQHQSTAAHSTIAYDLTAEELEGLEVPVVDQVATRPLVLLFAWMLSRNSHIEKYREFWTRRGYDILTVQTSPIDLLIPSLGGKKVASNVFNFLSKIQPRYDQVVIHAFSVGGYQLGEFLGRLYEGIERGEEEAERLYQSLKGFLIDSVVFADDAAPGLSRAITQHPIGQPILEKSIASWLTATKPFTYDRYKVVEAHIIDNKRRVPSMLLFSKDDVVSNFQSNFGVVESWKKKGITTKAKCWEKSAHVLHYKEHPEEYEQEIDGFVKQMNVTKAPVRN